MFVSLLDFSKSLKDFGEIFWRGGMGVAQGTIGQILVVIRITIWF